MADEEYVTCPKCGVTQRPDTPICTHLAGKKGGNSQLRKGGVEFYREIGAKGGRAVREKHGREHYQEIGRLGGKKVKETRGTHFYEEIGAKRGARMKELCAKGKKVESSVEVLPEPEPGPDVRDLILLDAEEIG